MKRLLLPSVTLFGLAVLSCVGVAGRAFYYAARDYGGRSPPAPIMDHPDRIGIAEMVNVEFPSRDGTRLRGWYVPTHNSAAVVVTSGTDSDRLAMLREVRILAQSGFGVLAFDWPGTGQSGGRIDWGNGSIEALKGAIDWLAQRPEVDPRRLGALGFSIGGMETVRVAATDPRLQAVVLSGTRPDTDASPHWIHWAADPLHSLPIEWAERLYGWPQGRIRAIELVGRIAPRAVYLIGGTQDISANAQMMVQMCAAAGSPKECWVVPGASHGAYGVVAPVEYARRLTEFFTGGLRVSAQGLHTIAPVQSVP
jgi:uncharacterized protein